MADPARVPQHVGLILDGNGRWASGRGLPRTAGHAAGEAALFDTVEGALELGIKWLTAYTFSTENWSRDQEEVDFLMWFNQDLLTRRRDALADQGVRMYFIGDLADSRIPDHNRKEMEEASELTKHNDKLNLVFAFNYGSRREIANAASALAAKAVAGAIKPEAIDEVVFSSFLYLPEMPPLDLVIRSSGEHRLSNFLLWQAAYAEFWFPGILWPDFNRRHLQEAVTEFQQRVRRFGAASET